MNTVFLATIFRASDNAPVFRFVSPESEGRANYLAGACMDAAHDITGALYDYSVQQIAYAGPLLPEHHLLDAARDGAVAANLPATA